MRYIVLRTVKDYGVGDECKKCRYAVERKGKQEKGDRESHLSKFVFLNAAKVQFVVEMVSSALAFLQHFEAELSAALHY